MQLFCFLGSEEYTNFDTFDRVRLLYTNSFLILSKKTKESAEKTRDMFYSDLFKSYQTFFRINWDKSIGILYYRIRKSKEKKNKF